MKGHGIGWDITVIQHWRGWDWSKGPQSEASLNYVLRPRRFFKSQRSILALQVVPLTQVFIPIILALNSHIDKGGCLPTTYHLQKLAASQRWSTEPLWPILSLGVEEKAMWARFIPEVPLSIPYYFTEHSTIACATHRKGVQAMLTTKNNRQERNGGTLAKSQCLGGWEAQIQPNLEYNTAWDPVSKTTLLGWTHLPISTP